MSMPDANPKVRWLHVVVYYLLACAISWPFFWWRDMLHWQGFKGLGIIKTMSIMWGPGIAGLVCLALFRKEHVRTVSLMGSNVVRSLICWFAPLALLAILGVREGNGAVSHTLPLLISFMAVFTILGEEVGWRGFLQDALRPLKPAQRYVLIGVMWEIWHFTNRVHDRTPLQATTLIAMFLIVTILLSWVIGEAVEKSKSILVATAIHGWVDLIFEMPGTTTYICAGFAVVLWVYMLKTWRVKPVA